MLKTQVSTKIPLFRHKNSTLSLLRRSQQLHRAQWQSLDSRAQLRLQKHSNRASSWLWRRNLFLDSKLRWFVQKSSCLCFRSFRTVEKLAAWVWKWSDWDWRCEKKFNEKLIFNTFNNFPAICQIHREVAGSDKDWKVHFHCSFLGCILGHLLCPQILPSPRAPHPHWPLGLRQSSGHDRLSSLEETFRIWRSITPRLLLANQNFWTVRHFTH